MRAVLRLLVFGLLLAATACDDGGEPDGDGDADSDGDADGDSDADGDGDTDADADGDGDADEDAGEELTECPPPPAGLPEVVEVGSGRYRQLLAVPYPGIPTRDVVVYLPPSYDSEPDRRYPVLYMHDGQNLFDPADAAFGVEWQLDETMDALAATGAIREHVVVGVYNTAERISDYTPDVDPMVGAGGNADLYGDFLVDVLKPIVDARFRTLCGRSNTALAGSSLGGLVTLHIGMRAPETFGRLGCVSPSLWWNDRSTLAAFESYSGRLPFRLWLDAGSAEGEPLSLGLSSTIANVRDARAAALGRGMAYGQDIGCLEDLGAGHDEAAWAARLPSILGFLLSDAAVRDTSPSALTVVPYHAHLALTGDAASTTLAVEALHGGVRLTWPNEQAELESLTPTVVTVAADGTVRAAGPGTGTIRAHLAGLTAEAELEAHGSADVDVELLVTVPASTPSGAAVYVSGAIPELGSWDPGAVPMTRLDATHFSLTIRVTAGTVFEYKYTRGSWATVEKAADGSDVPNRVVVADSSGTAHDAVASWADAW